MRMKSLAIAALLLLPLCGWAQEEEPKTNPFVNEVGINAGFTTGLGLSYRHWFDSFGLQLTGMPFKHFKEALISVGLTPMYSMYNGKYTRIFAYWGNHLCHRSWISKQYQEHSVTGEYVVSREEPRSYTQYNTGVGFGFSFGRVVAFNISLGYGAYDVLGGYENLSLLPTGEIGLYWRF